MAIKCKRIIDGKTYNTETSTQIEGWTTSHEPHYPGDTGEYLYHNRFGAFFLYSFKSGFEEEDHETIVPYTPDQARKWLEEHRSYRVDLIESLFGRMPEAGSGESKFTLRMPDSLRERLAEHAKANNQSLNAWIIRCLESCAVDSESKAGESRQDDVPPMGNLARDHNGVWRPRRT